MKLLTEVEPETKVVVKQIEGGSEVKAYLSDLGIVEDVKLTLLAEEPVHAHVGPLSVRIGTRQVILSQGWADKIFVEKEGTTLPLLRMEKGDKGVVKAIEGGKDLRDWVSELGFSEGYEVEFLCHIPHETLLLKVAGKEIKMGQGKASRIWVKDGAETVQLNNLVEGKKAKVTKVVGSTRHKEQMKEAGIKEGVEITLAGREALEAMPQRRGNYVLAKLGEQVITIGRGMAEKVLVE
ncbi:MAG: ferrous iron transport protein A [Chloroflexi bacterium]|nr:ferrous iron transport protein A [Chloroflexota bacterium]